MNGPREGAKRRCLTIMALGLAPLLAVAQLPTQSILPDEVVLVVRSTGDERVEPTTGVVFARNKRGEALVAIPSTVAAADGELFILDGGTDITLHGRPATRVPTEEVGALAVLAVPGLERPTIRVTFNPPEIDHELRLAAWPSADRMAAGDLPIWVSVNVAGTTPGQGQALLEGQTIPNVTGPLLDLCGQWAGMLIATDNVTTGATGAPQILLNDALLETAELMGITLRREACEEVAPIGSVIADTRPTTTAPPTRTTDRVPDRGFIGNLLKDAQLGLGSLVFLLSVAVSGLVFWIVVKRRAAAQRRRKLRRTLQTETVTFSSSGLPTRQTRVETATFEPKTPPTESRGWLRIEGTHADGRPLRAVTALRDGTFKAVIGRAGVELSADGPGISRKHAVLVIEGGKMTLSDLGSRNGTFINGVHCLPDEVFVLSEDDTVLLGAAQVKVRISPGTGPVT
jgi:hypothetical protein